MSLSLLSTAQRTTRKWCLILGVLGGSVAIAAPNVSTPEPTAPLKQYCTGCHGKALATAGINVEELIASKPAISDANFAHWQKVATVLEQKQMPPAKLKQPSDEDRGHIAAWIRARLDEYAQKNAGDPGKVTVRRLTSGEYGYTIHDLTGLDLKFDRDFASDSVGGEGFTNFGDVQYMADANLERYLEAARLVADHAVVGSGRLRFYDNPGKSGFELSAIDRINALYKANGFRGNSGEGGKPYGMDRVTNAFLVCWKYQHKATLGMPRASLEQIAVQDKVSPRFAQHLWSVVNLPSPVYPISEVVKAFRNIPAPSAADPEKSLAAARAGADKTMRAAADWPRWLLAAGAVAEGGEGDERSLVLTERSLKAEPTHKFRYVIRSRGTNGATVYFSVLPADADAKDKPMVIWRNAILRTRGKDRGMGNSQPLLELLDQPTRDRLRFGKGPEGVTVGPNDFVATEPVTVEVKLPEGAAGGLLEVEGEYVPGPNKDAIIRAVVANGPEATKGIPAWGLLGNSDSPAYNAWLRDVLEFARLLPINSHGEATPSDKDP
ncbi:MAG TPA: DUF1587 domain-containing protein, partial [Bryobacteraceae bacterium]|nr:DUF1587 domain-containing protein [Bryobacteraceae bacterium]